MRNMSWKERIENEQVAEIYTCFEYADNFMCFSEHMG
jgi:hypothetical protein